MSGDEKRLRVGDVTVSTFGDYRWRVVEVRLVDGRELYVLESERGLPARTWPLTYEQAVPRGWTVERALHGDDCDGSCCRSDIEPTASEPRCAAVGCEAVLGGPGDGPELCSTCTAADREREERERETGA